MQESSRQPDSRPKMSDQEIEQVLSETREKKAKLITEVSEGTMEVRDGIKEIVEGQISDYFQKFDDYVRSIQDGNPIDPTNSPSRNEHRSKFFKELPEEEHDLSAAYWIKLFKVELDKRNIPHGSTAMNGILYSGKLPEDIKIPE